MEHWWEESHREVSCFFYLLLLEDFRSSEFQELTKHRTTANDGTLSVDDESREFSGFVIIFKLC